MNERQSGAATCAGPATPFMRSPLARHGQWLILIWAPLLLGAYILAAAHDHQWRDLVLLVVTCVVFLLTIVNFYRPPAVRRLAVPVWIPLLVLGAMVVLVLSTIRTVESSDLAFMSLALLAIATAVVLPPRTVPAVVVLVAVCGAVAGLLAGWGWALVSWLTVTTVLSGMGTFLVHRLGATVGELNRTRAQLAESAVSAERMRFSRDLHDLLGHTLSVIVVKAEAVRRLAEADPAAAAAHGAEIETLGRSALAEVRQAVAGYREGGLEDEVSRAAAALRAGGIRPEIGHVPPGLDPGAERQLAWVVREATTNVLRHSGAGSCRITVERPAGRARVTIADDGHGTSDGMRNGTGLVGLRERLAGRGGTVTVEHGPDGFTLVAEIPLAGPHASPGATELPPGEVGSFLPGSEPRDGQDHARPAPEKERR